ncbi:MAG: bacterioferritin [Betaproteobacteria bacterium]|nr:bacterioferritin [Betaproteobacteria bacterium]
MQGDSRVTAFLGQVLTHALSAIQQHFIHSCMFRAWGLNKLAEYEYQEAIGGMKYADKLIGRMLFLEVLPRVRQPGKLHLGENVSASLKGDLMLGAQARALLKEAIAHCETAGDLITRELFEDIMDSEAEHQEWIEAQLGLIERTGLQSYQQSQS